MKKMMSLLLSGFIVTGMLGLGTMSEAYPAAAASTAPVKVLVAGKEVHFTAQPVLVKNRLLVPAEAMSKHLGMTYAYDAGKKTITLKMASNLYVFPIDSNSATINGVPVTSDVSATMMNGVPYIPLRILGEYLGMGVTYQAATRTAAVKTDNVASFRILSPKEGDVLHTTQIKVGIAAFHHQLVDFRQHMQAAAGQGHIHVWLDTDPKDPKVAYKMISGEPAVFDNVQPGNHTLTVQLVGNDHKPLVPEVKQVIHFQTVASSTEKPAPAQATKTYSVDIHSYMFMPGEITVEAGSTVTFTNSDDVNHTVTAKDGSFDSGPISKGKSYSVTFSKPGVYQIYCKPHTFMTGTITVK